MIERMLVLAGATTVGLAVGVAAGVAIVCTLDYLKKKKGWLPD